MKQKCIIFFILVLTIFLLVSCGSKDERLNKPDTLKSETLMEMNYLSHINAEIINQSQSVKTEVDINEVNSTLTLKDALDLFGKPRISETNSNYPIVCSWEMGDGEVLYLIFERDDQKEFKEKFDNGEYILPDEVVRYEEDGLRHVTDNELKVLREWIMDHTPVCAYIVQNGEKNFLFDLR